MALAPAARPDEQALIEALARRYAADPAADRRSLDAAYAEAMMDVAKRYPDDADITVLTAEALMDLSPWDYWQAGGAEPKGHTAEIVRMLEAVMERNPDHIGAIHYYIHMVEASDRPERAVPGADRLASFDLGPAISSICRRTSTTGSGGTWILPGQPAGGRDRRGLS